MATVFSVLNMAHWVGFALIIVGWVLSFGRSSIHPAMVWGARLQLLIGLGLVGILESVGADVNHMMVGIKLVLAVVIVALCEMANARARRARAAGPVSEADVVAGGTSATSTRQATATRRTTAGSMTLVHVAGVLSVLNGVVGYFFMA